MSAELPDGWRFEEIPGQGWWAIRGKGKRPATDLEAALLAGLSRVEQERDKAREALDVYADFRHWAIDRTDRHHPAAIWIGPGAEEMPVPHPTMIAAAVVGREDA
jgi:hypothetical protein